MEPLRETRGLRQEGLGSPYFLDLGGHRLAIRTEDAEGRPVSASVDLRSQEPWATSADTRTAADGLLDLDGVQAGLYAVQVEFQDGAWTTVPVTVRKEARVVIRAPAIGTLIVRVVDEGGAPVDRAYVTAVTWPGSGDPPDEHRTWLEHANLRRAGSRADAGGRATLDSAYAGEVQELTIEFP